MLLAEPALAPPGAVTVAQVDQPAMREYRRKLDAYMRAREAYDGEATAYWNAITEKRKLRITKRRGQQEIALADYVTFWIPVTDTTVANGTIRFQPGRHRAGPLRRAARRWRPVARGAVPG